MSTYKPSNPEKIAFLEDVALLAKRSAFPVSRKTALAFGTLILHHLEYTWRNLPDFESTPYREENWKIGAKVVWKIIHTVEKPAKRKMELPLY